MKKILNIKHKTSICFSFLISFWQISDEHKSFSVCFHGVRAVLHPLVYFRYIIIPSAACCLNNAIMARKKLRK